jgi:hypothetical protein
MPSIPEDQRPGFAVRLKQLRKRISHSEFFMEALAILAVGFLRLLSATWKQKIFFHPDFEKIDRTKAVYGFWEGRHLGFVPYFAGWNVCVLVDASFAGRVLIKILNRFGYQTAMGSSKRRGAEALFTLITKIREGCLATISLDGPRGPVCKSKPGALFLCQKVRQPFVPVATAADRAWILKSTWCSYMIPKPFARVHIGIGQPVHDVMEEGKMTTEDIDRLVSAWTEEVDRRAKNSV